jgi:hypothetical protein
MDDGTTGGYQGITPILFFAVILVLLNRCYIITCFPMFGVYPAVLQLQLYLPSMQSVTYNDDENLEDVVSRPGSNRTTLTEYFTKNREERKQGKYCIENFQNTTDGSQ